MNGFSCTTIILNRGDILIRIVKDLTTLHRKFTVKCQLRFLTWILYFLDVEEWPCGCDTHRGPLQAGEPGLESREWNCFRKTAARDADFRLVSDPNCWLATRNMHAGKHFFLNYFITQFESFKVRILENSWIPYENFRRLSEGKKIIPLYEIISR